MTALGGARSRWAYSEPLLVPPWLERRLAPGLQPAHNLVVRHCGLARLNGRPPTIQLGKLSAFDVDWRAIVAHVLRHEVDVVGEAELRPKPNRDLLWPFGSGWR
jgi:hypothetical protein